MRAALAPVADAHSGCRSFGRLTCSAGSQVDLVPAMRHQFRHAKAVPVCDQDEGSVDARGVRCSTPRAAGHRPRPASGTRGCAQPRSDADGEGDWTFGPRAMGLRSCTTSALIVRLPFPRWGTASMGQRNTRLKFIGWRLEPQGLSRTLIQAPSDLVEV